MGRTSGDAAGRHSSAVPDLDTASRAERCFRSPEALDGWRARGCHELGRAPRYPHPAGGDRGIGGTMTTRSAGVMLFKRDDGEPAVFLVHMGGPFWERRDQGGWSIPKGEYVEGQNAWSAAQREFAEETGAPCPDGQRFSLGELRLSSGKVIVAWAIEADFDATSVSSNNFTLEWPRGSGIMREFPEVDRGAWFDLQTARSKLTKGQVPLLDRLVAEIVEL